jgi:hypothetical protein
MLETILDTLKISASNDDFDSRRSSQRREMDNCVGIIDGKTYPIQNWSNGGVMLSGDDRLFGVNEIKEITMKFKLAQRVIDVPHRGRVLRKGNNEFVLEFSPLTESVDNKFKMVIDDYNAKEFANSQA